VKAIEKPHVAGVVARAKLAGAVVEDDSKAKLVRMTIRGERFFIIGNDVTPTFAFHPKLARLLLRLGIHHRPGAHSGLQGFPASPKPQQQMCLKLSDPTDAETILKAIYRVIQRC
jgi:hypothetical protein